MNQQAPTGILNQAAGAPAAPAAPQGAGNMPPPNPEIMSPIVAAHMDELEQMASLMDGKLGDAYDRVLTAGMKMMYSPDNAQMMQDIITNEEIPIANKLGEGVANLLLMMDNTGNGTIPKEVLVPVGVALMFEAADYLFELDIEVTEADLGAALELLIKGVFVGYGIDPAKVDQIVDDMGAKLGFDETEEGKKIAGMPGETEAATGEAEAGESGIEPMDEEAAMQQGFKDEQKRRLGVE
jgi:hypothetical protein